MRKNAVPQSSDNAIKTLVYIKELTLDLQAKKS